MSKSIRFSSTGLFGLAMFILCAIGASAHAQEVKPKPPMYTYVADWQVARANWADMEKVNAPVNEALQKSLADGTLVGYGTDINLVHELKSETHDVWWSSMSLAGIVKVLEQARGASDAGSAVLNSAKHWDEVFVSRYYNWKSGSYKNAYTRVASYKLKDDAPDDAVEMLSEHMIVPLLEKMVADGTVLEYEIDTMAIHTEAPGTFDIVYIAAKPEGLDTVLASLREALKTQPLSGQAFGSMVVDAGHRDELLKSEGAYK